MAGRDDVLRDLPDGPGGRREVDLEREGVRLDADPELRVDEGEPETLPLLPTRRPFAPGPPGGVREVEPPFGSSGEGDAGGITDLEDDVLPVLDRPRPAAGLPTLRRIREDKDGGPVGAVREVEQRLLREARFRAVLFPDPFGRGVSGVEDDNVVLPDREVLPRPRFGERRRVLAA